VKTNKEEKLKEGTFWKRHVLRKKLRIHSFIYLFIQSFFLFYFFLASRKLWRIEC